MNRREFLTAVGAGSAGLALACSKGPRAPGGVGPAAEAEGDTSMAPRTKGRGMAATSQRLATDTGVAILRDGGNAADAAVAIAAVLNVTEPTSTGLGGDCFALHYEGATGKITALNGSGRAPAGLSLELLRRQGLTSLPPLHGHTITVPGACAGWLDLLERHGSLKPAAVLAPAIAMASEGFPVAPTTAHFWDRGAQKLAGVRGFRETLTIDGRAPAAGERFRNPGLARTLSALADGGKEAYYRGDIAKAVVEAARSAGSVMTLEDLASHTSTWDEPISVSYRGMRVWECPPNGQGLAALLALSILDGFDLRALDPLGPERQHLLVEALRLAFADTRWYVADPAFDQAPLAGLLSPDYGARRRKRIDPARAAADVKRGAPVAGSDTIYFCVVDGWGNACSFINSNYMGFGTGLVPTGWGFTLHNRGHLFALDPAHPNALEPRKRPYHTIIPGMITRADGSLYAPFGVMGGFMQPQGHVQVVVALLDDGAAPQAAVDRPRFCIDPVDGPGKLNLEEGMPEATVKGLAARGHDPLPGVSGYDRALFGRGQIIRRDPDGVLTGGSDPRADGYAAGT